MNIDIAHCVVESVITADYAVTLGLSSGATVRLETTFELSTVGSDPVAIDPQSLEVGQNRQASLIGRTVTMATASMESGSLTIRFGRGVALRAPANSDFEAWSAIWPDGSMILSLPGGGLGVWGVQS